MMKKSWMLLIFLASCRGGYNAPDVAISKEFINQNATKSERAFNPRYWELLNDPVLNELVGKVFEKNLSYLQAKERVQELRAQYNFQTSQLFPQISGGGSIKRERDTQTLTFSQFTGTQYQTLYQLGFDATWELDFFGSQLAAKQSAFFTMMSQKEKADYMLLTLVSELILDYANLRYYQGLVDCFKKEAATLEEIYSLSSKRYKRGLNAKMDSLLNLARFEDRNAVIEKTNLDVDQLSYAISKIVSEFPDKEQSLLKNYKTLDSNICLIYPEIPSEIILNRPDVKSARFSLFSAQAQLKKAYRDFFPQFSITSALGSLTNFPNLLFKPQSLQWNIMPGFNLTLIDFGALNAAKNVAKSKEKQAIYFFEETLINAFTEIETALASVKAIDLQIKKLEDEKNALSEKSKDYLDRYNRGLSDKLPYLEAYLEELYVDEALLTAINNRLGFSVAFYKALGVSL